MTKTRESNFELLRILLMIFVVTEHLIPVISDIQNQNSIIEYYLGNILKSFFVVAVNCYIIISGYFGIEFNIVKLLKIEMKVLFYSISGFLLSLVFGFKSLDIKQDLRFLMPTISRVNWFVTIYFVLCIIAPILNWVIKNLTKKQIRIIIGIMIIVFYLLPTLQYMINVQTIVMDSGYGITNFICLYFIGRYIRIYNIETNKKKALLLYILISISLFLVNHILGIILGFYFNSLISYDTIFCLVGALSLFMVFKEINISSIFINKIARYSFTVYILHTCIFYKDILFNIAKLCSNSNFMYLLTLIVFPCLIYMISIIIEFVRNKTFGNIEDKIINAISSSKFCQNLENMYLEF